ncbi:hypothetical protein C3V36_01320 [Lachnospiraceae bacterium oral taxon 500]|nr:hypothetical protein C3V36_01320 [Lachnospiraceae bacterium oral taxon 500]
MGKLSFLLYKKIESLKFIIDFYRKFRYTDNTSGKSMEIRRGAFRQRGLASFGRICGGESRSNSVL